MKIFNNANRLTTTTLAALACAAFVGCTNSNERTVSTDPTVSNTTLAADDTPKTLDTTGEVPSAAADSSSSNSASAEKSSKTTTETKTSKHMKHRAKKAHHKNSDEARVWTAPAPVVRNSDQSDAYTYDQNISNSDSMDVANENDQTVSGVTMAPDVYRETGLSPFSQEPFSRMPSQIGSGQVTGEDKNLTILDGPGLFQDPSALGRSLIK